MKISVDVTPDQIAPAMAWLDGKVGAALDKRVKSLEQQQSRNPLFGPYFRDTFPYELALVKARRHQRQTGLLPSGEEYGIAYGFAAALQRIHAGLGEKGRARLESTLRGAMKDAYGLRPLAYEVQMATHAARRGYDVECVDLDGAGQFDLLLTRDADEIELECKTTSPDKGKKVHQSDLVRLANLLLPTTAALANYGGCHAIRVIVPARLATSDPGLAEIASLVRTAVDRRGAAGDKDGRAEYSVIQLPHWPERDMSAREESAFLNEIFGTKNRPAFWHLRERHGFVAVQVDSDQPDASVEALSEDAKKAADQCTGKRPAVVAMQLMEITPDELKFLLDNPSPAHDVAHAIFKDGRRAHVDSLALSLPARSRDVDSGKELWGTVAVLHNPSPAYPSRAARSLFSANG
ncbi:MAG TPA: hypothetical protein VGU20_00690 [Stellaceae bacterium]|nr:hypothetical protein [Stellaceae bacterium]